MKLYFAIVGRTCAGKDTIYKIVKEKFGDKYFISIHGFSDPLNEILDLIHQPRSRPNQQGISTDLRTRFGENVLGNIIRKRVLADTADIVFLNGVRRMKDVEMLREMSNSFLIYVYAPAEKRFERLRKRADRPGDAEKTWEEFQAEQAAEAESLIESLRPMANYEIDNSEDDPKEFKTLRDQVVSIINEKLNLPKERKERVDAT
jgi:dephospho-CoA kinase